MPFCMHTELYIWPAHCIMDLFAMLFSFNSKLLRIKKRGFKQVASYIIIMSF